MSDRVVIQGAVNPDGTLELNPPVPLPPGPVEVTVWAIGQPKEDTWAVLERMRAESKALGLMPRTVQRIDAHIDALRDESEAELQAIEELQRDAPEVT
jgi:hypothetical protein